MSYLAVLRDPSPDRQLDRHLEVFSVGMQIPWNQLSAEALRGLVEEYITREGTDYGHREVSLERKVEQVMAQLRDGTAVVSYDPDTDSVTIVPIQEWQE